MNFEQFELLMTDVTSKTIKNHYMNDSSIVMENIYQFNKHIISVFFDKNKIIKINTTLEMNQHLYQDPTLQDHNDLKSAINYINNYNQNFVYITSFGMF